MNNSSITTSHGSSFTQDFLCQEMTGIMKNNPDGIFDTQWDKLDRKLMFCPFIYE
jgi:hypothetical protein